MEHHLPYRRAQVRTLTLPLPLPLPLARTRTRARIRAQTLTRVLTWTSSYPIVLRTRIAASSGLANTAPSGLVAATAQEVYRSGGVRAFYRGISMTLLRAGPVAGVLLPVNDFLYDALARRAAAAS